MTVDTEIIDLSRYRKGVKQIELQSGGNHPARIAFKLFADSVTANNYVEALAGAVGSEHLIAPVQGGGDQGRFSSHEISVENVDAVLAEKVVTLLESQSIIDDTNGNRIREFFGAERRVGPRETASEIGATV